MAAAGAVAAALAGRGGRSWVWPHLNDSTLPLSWMRCTLNDIRLTRARARADQAFLFGLPGNADDLVLRLFDIAQPDRAHDFHLFSEQVGGALRHVGEEALADILAGAFQGDGEDLLVGAIDDLADAGVFDLHEIF